jgi:hypothetical protein
MIQKDQKLLELYREHKPYHELTRENTVPTVGRTEQASPPAIP